MTEPTVADPLLPADPDDFANFASFGPAAHIPGEPETEPEEELTEEQQAAKDLDPQAMEDFIGLLRLGYLEDECTAAGHRFLLRTPSQDDRLDMGLVHRPYLNSMSTEPAWQMVFVSAYVRRIGSVVAPEPLNSNMTGVRTRFEWVKNQIASPFVISLLYQECMALAARERAVVEYVDRLGER